VARHQKYHKKRAEGSFLSGFNYSAFSHFSINKKAIALPEKRKCDRFEISLKKEEFF